MRQSAKIFAAMGGLLLFAGTSAATTIEFSSENAIESTKIRRADKSNPQQRDPESRTEYVVDQTGSVKPSADLNGDIKTRQLDAVSPSVGDATKVSILVNEPSKGDLCGPSPMTVAQIVTVIEEMAARHGVDPVFVKAIAQAESNFGQLRDSPAGAHGEMQLIAATAARFGVKDICDPTDNIEGGVKYLRWLFDEFKNPVLVAAAYNSGEGRIYEYGGVPPFTETVRYVARVINITLGVELPSRRRLKSPSPLQAKATRPAETPPVANTADARQFVDGVWNF
ncbi:lytic transglycosylase domain-containing protein [Agrobacterium vitis]|uniref:lytic transglycosylase domain-containing protein n=1 Tax=Allorhizobium ampelinum TaxID=3025782 RepID=UPI001F1F7025|nr:lytic transglycosylase domain-containing protein [Allorhizobium ampelinum]MCF1450517.1 lytic transglycosylase domain-containing protein [Allorhizobium ampelinum]